MHVANWQLMPINAGNSQFFVLVDDKGRTKAQGRKNLCEAVKQSYRFMDDANQRRERLAFYGVVR